MKQAQTLPCWPRLMGLKTASAYLDISTRTLEDWVHEGLLEPVAMPGSRIKDRAGNLIANSASRRIAKILIDKADIDALIDRRKVVL